MLHAFSRTQMLFGEEVMQRLYGAHVAVFGVGGVGGHAAEAKEILAADDDEVARLRRMLRQIGL